MIARALPLAVAALAFAGAAEAADPYFKGRTISIIVGFGAGGPTDLANRLLAKHMGENIAGNPTVVVRAMEGAGGIRAHNYIFESAKPNGEEILATPWFPIAQVLESPGLRFRYQDYSLIAASRSTGFVMVARKDAAPGGIAKSADILKGQALKFAGMNPSASIDLLGRLSFDLFDIRYTYVSGYRGTPAMRPALMKDEVNVYVEPANGYRSVVRETIVKPGTAVPLWTYPRLDDSGKWIRQPDLPDIPTVNEVYREAFGKEPEGIKWQALDLTMGLLSTVGQLMLGPPGMDKAIAAELRKGVDAAVADKEFRAGFNKIMGVDFEPIDVATAEKVIRSLTRVDPKIVVHLKAHVASGGQAKQ